MAVLCVCARSDQFRPFFIIIRHRDRSTVCPDIIPMYVVVLSSDIYGGIFIYSGILSLNEKITYQITRECDDNRYIFKEKLLSTTRPNETLIFFT